MSGAGRRNVWVLASANPGKAAEMAALLSDIEEISDVRPRPPGVPGVIEDRPDLEGNARLKADAVGRATGLVAVADDTGLFVDALDGQPGVRSARFAGDDANDEDNVELLLARLLGVSADERTAHFSTVVVVARPDGTHLVVDGRVDGRILEDRRGSEGFGYDPVFVPDEGDGRTFAEMGSDEKNLLSHRGRALRDLASRLESI